MSGDSLISPVAWERNLFTFVRREMAASPARWHATLRTALACAICITLVMVLQIPQGEFLMVTLFIVAKTDAWASVNRAVLRVVGTLFGGALAIVAIITIGDKPWLMLPLQGLVVAVTLFFNRTSTAPYAFFIGGVTYLLVAPEFISTPGFDIERGLWRTLLTTVGALIGTASQLFFWPDHPERLLLDDLTRRLSMVEGFIARHANRRLGDPVDETGMASQLDLLKEAEAMSAYLRQRHAEQIKLIVDVQRLTSAVVRLSHRNLDLATLPPWLWARLDAVRAESARLRQAIATRRAPAPTPQAVAVPTPTPASAGEVEALAAIEEMESALAGLPRLLAFLDTPPEGGLHGELLPREPIAQTTLFTPACTLANTEVLQHAIKGGLAASICGLIYVSIHRPELSTCVITCLVVAQSTVGAGRYKSILRLVGTFLGGLGALLAILVLIPNMTSLASLLVVSTPLFAAAAWVVSGSSRVSYIGMQMAIALSLVLINGLAPTVDLAPAFDRFIGVLLGTVVMGIVDQAVWPVFAHKAIRRKLAQALSLMADFHAASAAGDEERRRRGSIAIYRALSEAVQLQDGLALEPLKTEAEETERNAALRLTSSLQDAFLQLLAVYRHRATLTDADAVAIVGSLDGDIETALRRLAEARPRVGPPLGDAAAERLRRLAQTSAANDNRELVTVYRDLFAALQRVEGDLRAAS